MVVLCTVFEILITPFENKCIDKEANAVALRITNEAYDETIKEFSFEYDDLAIINYSDNNDVTSISINSANVNQFQSYLLQKIQENLDLQKVYYFSLPLGAFTRINEFTDNGPNVVVNFRLTGTASCQIKSTFESEGVNQTVHNIIVVINIDMNTISAEYTSTITYSTELQIAQTVIVGDVPQGYANIDK